MKQLAIAAGAAALTACSMGTGILPAGPDTYTVTERRAPVLGGSTTAQQSAMTEANAFCAQQGRQFLPVDMATPPSANPYGTTGYSVTFRCLLPGVSIEARLCGKIVVNASPRVSQRAIVAGDHREPRRDRSAMA
jgi:hypothetical protein